MDYLSRGLSLYIGRKRRNCLNSMGIRVLWQQSKKKKVGFVGLIPGMCCFCFSIGLYFMFARNVSLRWKIWVYVCIFIMKEVKQSDPSIQQLVSNLLSSCFSCSSKRTGTVSFPGSKTSPWLQKQKVLLSLWEMLWTLLSISSCGKMLQQRQCWWKWVAEEYCKIHVTVEPSMTVWGSWAQGHTGKSTTNCWMWWHCWTLSSSKSKASAAGGKQMCQLCEIIRPSYTFSAFR